MNQATAPRRSNRRLTARQACLLVVSYKAGRDWHPATAMDLSPQGCRLRIGQDLERDSHVLVRFSRPGDGEDAPVEVGGTVMWCRLEGLSHQCGIHFREGMDELAAVLGALA